MEFLATFGLAAKELFDYNRENYSFDAEQRLQRELMRLDMQVTRFEMFREDIRDLVELTVGKMEMYHLVGALFLEKTVALYCEGRFKQETPPFLLALYFMSIAASYAFLVLAVWLSMYASICSHSFGVRLLTRFVRLPIPGAEQLDSINAHLGDFEQQGAAVLRVPFIGGDQEWKRRHNLERLEEEGGGSGAASSSGPAHVRGMQEDFLGHGEQPLGAIDHIMKASTQLPGKHVHLYRRLQNKWQCYDAYARVAMALGTNCILLAFTFYLIGVTLVQFSAGAACFALIAVFQFTALALCYIDIAKLGHVTIFVMQSLPCGSAVCAAIRIYIADAFWLEYVCFFLLVAWFEVLLHAAWPSSDGASLPRRFRAVLFLDVFEDAGLTLEEAEGQTAVRRFGGGFGGARKPLLTVQIAREADDALFEAHAALRRWEAVPAGLSEAQRRDIAGLRQDINVWRNALNAEAAHRAGRRGMADAAHLLELDERPWNELSEQEQEEDPHADTLIGPFLHADHRGSQNYFYHVETSHFVHNPDGRRVLSIQDARELVKIAEERVTELLSPGGAGADSSSGEESGMDHDSEDSPSAPALRGGGRGGARQVQTAASNNYVPPRLPWRILHLMTRGLQMAYLFMGITTCIQVSSDVVLSVDTYTEAEERRRLAAVAAWSLEAIAADFPQGDVFQPSSLSCVPGRANAFDDALDVGVGSGDVVLLGTRHAVYVAPVVDGQAKQRSAGVGRMQPLAEERFPPGTVAFCAGRSDASAQGQCLLGALFDGGMRIAVWPFGGERAEAKLLRIAAERPWLSLDGAVLPCDAVSSLLDGRLRGEGQLSNTSCLLLAGFDGARVPVAALALFAGVTATPLPADEVVPSFDFRPSRPPPLRRLPLDRRGIARDKPKAAMAMATATTATTTTAPVPSMNSPGASSAEVGLRDVHVDVSDAGRPTVWALHNDGSLQAWDLAGPSSLGSWPPAWSGADLPELQAAALCRSYDGRMHVVGRGRGSGPVWYSGELPAASA